MNDQSHFNVLLGAKQHAGESFDGTGTRPPPPNGTNALPFRCWGHKLKVALLPSALFANGHGFFVQRLPAMKDC